MSLRYGPLNKNRYTLQLEFIAKCIIRDPKNIQLISKPNNTDTAVTLHLDMDGRVFNLSEIFKKANFSHIQLDETDSAHAIQQFNLKSRLSRASLAPHGKFPYLTEAEKITINAYTLSSEAINGLLYGNKNIKHELKTVIDCIFLASGLNKIPTTTLYNIPSESSHAILPSLRTYRGEIYMTDEMIEERKRLIESGGGISALSGFLSTSTNRKISQLFSQKSLIVFDVAYGKDITGLAVDPKEQEFLLVPSQIYWKQYKFKSPRHQFYAEVVMPLPDELQDDTAFDQDADEHLHLRAERPPSFQADPRPPITSTAPSLYPILSSIGLGGLIVLGCFVFSYSWPLIIAAGVISSMVSYSAFLLRNYGYKKANVNYSDRADHNDISEPEKSAFENGRCAARGWTPYFKSQFSSQNWRHCDAFAAGYEDELTSCHVSSPRNAGR